MAQRKPIYYFAYASNLNEAQMTERNVPWLTKQPAVLLQYEVVFNKKGIRYPGFSVANIQPRNGSSVEGIVYALPDEQAFAQLDTFEIGYDKVPVTVILKKDNTPCDAIVYIAKPEFVVNHLQPSDVYIKRICNGAKGSLSEEYIKTLLLKATE